MSKATVEPEALVSEQTSSQVFEISVNCALPSISMSAASVIASRLSKIRAFHLATRRIQGTTPCQHEHFLNGRRHTLAGKALNGWTLTGMVDLWDCVSLM